MSSAGARPLPLADRDSTPWWTALAEHELRLQRCHDCGTLRWPARALCNRCGSLDWSWLAASGRATVASWIVDEHPFTDAFPVPYVVVMARLDEQDDILVPGTFLFSTARRSVRSKSPGFVTCSPQAPIERASAAKSTGP